MKLLAKLDPMVLSVTEQLGQHITTGMGELHLENCLKDIEEYQAYIPPKSDSGISNPEIFSQEWNIVCPSAPTIAVGRDST